ncbi:MAG TPA: hypothetical protein VFB58_16880 [Chloroflexota bacterium]|nr:hypothetical protein [Chloroflexota bacterium]
MTSIRETAGRPDVVSARPAGSGAALAAPGVIFIVSRGFLAVVARYATSLIPALHRYPSLLPRDHLAPGVWAWLSPWFRFDARWYVDVAEHGYRYGAISQTNTNFFPLYPLLIRGAQVLTLGNPWFAALLVANAAFLAALLLLWSWADLKWDQQVALRCVLLTVAFPFAFFFAAPYAEPVFLALAVAAFYLAEQRRWGWAAAAAGFSAITRPVGVAVVAGLVVLALWRGDRRAAVKAALGILPFLGFVAYLWAVTGHPLAFAVYHTAGWVPPHGSVLHTVASQFHTRLSPFDRIDAALSAIFLLSGLFVWRMMGAGYGVLVLLGVFLPLTRSLAGMERYCAVLFPVFALWARRRNPFIQVSLFSLSLLALTIATVMFAAGYAIF